MMLRSRVVTGARGIAAVFWLLAIVACGDDGAASDAGSVVADAAQLDAPLIDSAVDAPVLDASIEDARIADAGMVDGGCSESPCRLVGPQCGCMGGQGCYDDGSGNRSCANAGSTGEGEICTGQTDCAPGLGCTDVGAGAVSVPLCSRYCETDGDCLGVGSLCISPVAGTTDTTCTQNCNPLTSAGCAAAASCQVAQESTGAMRFFTHCTGPTGTVGQGGNCTTATDCQPGFRCSGLPGQCLRYCDTPGASFPLANCPGTLTCFGFQPPLQPGGPGNAEYGVCDA